MTRKLKWKDEGHTVITLQPHYTHGSTGDIVCTEARGEEKDGYGHLKGPPADDTNPLSPVMVY